MAENAEQDEGIYPMPSGMVRLEIDGTTIMLRRLKIGELKALREDMQQQTDQQIVDSHQAQAEMEAIQLDWEEADAEVAKAIAEASGADRAELLLKRATMLADSRTAKLTISRKLDPVVEGRRIDWLRKVVEVASISGALPDELPAWCASDDVALRLLNHWITVPSGSGPS